MEETGIGGIMAFHWLSCDSLSLAVWLLGKEKILHLPTGVVEEKNIYVRDER